MTRTRGLVLSVALVPVLAWSASRPVGAESRSGRTVAVGVGRSRTSADSLGQRLFEENCRKCHGPHGSPFPGIRKLFPRIPTMDSTFFAARSDDSLVTILTNGKSEVMVSFKSKFSVAEMRAIASYIRSFTR